MAASHSKVRDRSRWHPWLRALLAGPCALALTALILSVMPFWMPKGAGGVDHIAFPLFFMPAIWGIIFFYALLDRNLGRVAITMTVIAAIHAIALNRMFAG
ncbi:hypothetical protein WI560_21905 [Bradyrhizobium sp. A11]|uniref:hypothetical protein n=1 Tax=Bradyrhizobium sp. A11 TaxID=3133974 RepID=UPI003245D83E